MTVVMCAPNGARRGKADHPALPVTTAEIVETAAAAAAAGADAVHLHVRRPDGGPSLDPDLYAQTIEAVTTRLGERLAVQASTETYGGFGPEDVETLIRTLKPAAASVAMRDLAPEPGDARRAKRLFDWAQAEGIGLQHILYAPEQIETLAGALPADAPASLLFALGRYDVAQQSAPGELIGFLAALERSSLKDRAVWMVCAFGAAETRCLAAAAALGGHCRIGFENNFQNADGARAADNAARVAEIRAALGAMGLGRPQAAMTQRALGR